MDKVIVLASGGLDSTLVMIKMLKEGHTVVPFFTNYNQFSYEGERKAVLSVVEWLQNRSMLPYLIREKLKERLGNVVEAKVDLEGQRVAASPGRILAFVGAATIWAYTNNWEKGKIAIGTHSGDKDVDSCRVGYESALDETLSILTQGCLKVITPLMGMTREEMAKELYESGIPFELMHNCYWEIPCRWKSVNDKYLCPGCRRKQEAINYVIETFPDYQKPAIQEAPNVGIMGRPVARRDWTKWV